MKLGLSEALKGPGAVPVIKHVLQLGPSAHAHYVVCLQKERMEKEEGRKEGALQTEVQKEKLAKEKDALQIEVKPLEKHQTVQQDSAKQF